MGDVQIQPDYPRGLTFEQVWAALMETRKNQEENARVIRESQQETARRQEETARQLKESQQETARRQEETARQIKETQKETDRVIKETQQETDRQIKDINKRFGEYSNRLGEISEYMIAPKLREKFNELNFNFQKTNKNTEVADHKNKIFFEIDFFLENYDKAMLVEVKTKLISDHVNAHIERLEKMRKYADLHGDKRVFLGAVAGAVIPDDIKNLALNHGLFVIEPSGETFRITPPIGKPKEW